MADDLTEKETKLLAIFSSHLNKMISRSQLLKEGWEDEGVITGRSLDVFISRLRKKLQHDSSVSLINYHGQGYKLSTDA
ncbi:MAG: helix-turn-helix domain-containing protein [Flavitalea sp.]